MKKPKKSRLILPIALAAMAFPGLTSAGCGAIESPLCDATIGARVEAFISATDALIAATAKLKNSVGASCVAIATDLGQKDVPDLSKPDDPDFDTKLQTACTLANQGLDAELKAGATLSLEIVGGQCTLAASAQFNCEAKCSVTGTCDPGGVELRCEPGDLSGTCEAKCTGDCTVTTGSVACDGGCSGQCTGDCSGACAVKDNKGKCAGKCTGKCSGQCTGTCQAVPPSAKCSGSCKGGCSVEYKAPTCEGTLKPPSCDLDADCQAGCSAEAQLTAVCTPPTINVVVTGGVTGKLASTLEANLPALYSAAIDQGPNVIEAAALVAAKGVDAGAAAVDSLGCLATYGVEVVSQFEASVSASVSVSVSIKASASVSAKAGAGN